MVFVDRTPADVPGRPEADAEISVVRPVDQVVPRLVPRPERSSRSRTSPGPTAARRPMVRGRTSTRSASSSTARTSPGVPLLPESGPLLVDEAVAGEVRRPEVDRASRGRSCHCSTVEPGTPKIRSSDHRSNRGRTRSRARPTSSGAWFRSSAAEQLGLERLGPEADAVDAPLGEDVGLVRVERARVGLDRPLAPVGFGGNHGGGSSRAAGPTDPSVEPGGRAPRRRRSCRPPGGFAAGRPSLDLAIRARRGSGRPGGRSRPARRSRNSRTCGRKKGRERTPRAARSRGGRPSPVGLASGLRGRPRGSGPRGPGPGRRPRSPWSS